MTLELCSEIKMLDLAGDCQNTSQHKHEYRSMDNRSIMGKCLRTKYQYILVSAKLTLVMF